jgi:hypothetical protein
MSRGLTSLAADRSTRTISINSSSPSTIMGRPPGILTEYAVEFCSLTDIRSVPAYGKRGYKRKAFHDRTRPVESKKRGSWHRSTSRRLLVLCSFMGAIGMRIFGKRDTRRVSSAIVSLFRGNLIRSSSSSAMVLNRSSTNILDRST